MPILVAASRLFYGPTPNLPGVLVALGVSVPLLPDCHVSYFMVPLSVLGLALPWAILSETVGTAKWVFQVRFQSKQRYTACCWYIGSLCLADPTLEATIMSCPAPVSVSVWG